MCIFLKPLQNSYRAMKGCHCLIFHHLFPDTTHLHFSQLLVSSQFDLLAFNSDSSSTLHFYTLLECKGLQSLFIQFTGTRILLECHIAVYLRVELGTKDLMHLANTKHLVLGCRKARADKNPCLKSFSKLLVFTSLISRKKNKNKS